MSSGIIRIAGTTYSVNESDGFVDIIVDRIAGSDGEAFVSYSTINGSAQNGQDFFGFNQRQILEFADGETQKIIRIPIEDDDIFEGEERFNFVIGDPFGGAELGSLRSTTIIIEDNDVLGGSSVSFSQPDFSVAEDAGEATITIVRTGEIDEEVSVRVFTQDSFAKANSNYPDYIPVNETLTFLSGETIKEIKIEIINDNLPEYQDHLSLLLANPEGIALGFPSQARLLIEDDDPAPNGFSKEAVLTEGILLPTDFDWIGNDQILIAEQAGIVHLLNTATGELTEFLNISEKVNISGQRGLLSLAVDPNFSTNHYIYLGYSSEIPGVEPDQNGFRDTLLVRIEADPSTDYTTALPDSEVVLMTVPRVLNFHASGGLRFGQDGSLFWAHGDGLSVSGVTNPSIEDFSRLDFPYGKLYRINPLTGEGYEDNPFFTGNSQDIESKVYSLGFRNPFRLAIHPKTGEPYVGDVGWTNWEEINRGRGENFGWPFYEGGQINGEERSLRTVAYSDIPEYQEFYDSNPEVAAPIYARDHDEWNSLILGDFLTGDLYPELYKNALFIADSSRQRVEALTLDDDGEIDAIISFPRQLIRSRITKMQVGPDGYLYFNHYAFPGEPQPSGIFRFAYEESGIDIEGTEFRDLYIGEGGDDRLEGLAGEDDLRGEGGRDRISGGAANDRLEGGDGSILSQEAEIIELTFTETQNQITPDSSLFGSKNDGKLENGVIVDTQLGIAKFDGIDDYIRFEITDDLNQTNLFKRTISLWFKAEDVGINTQKQVIYEEGGGARGLNIYLYDGALYVGGWQGVSDNPWITFLSTNSITSNSWHHVTLVLDAEQGNPAIQANAFRAYLDGIEFATGEGGELGEHPNPASLGAINVGTKFHDVGNVDGFGIEAFAGHIDEFRVFNRAVGLPEIEELATPFVSLEDQIIALALETVNNGNTPDTSPFGSDNAGIVHNGVIIDPVSETARFDGIDDYISFQSRDDLNLQTQHQRTISLRFKADDVDINQNKQVLYEEGGGARGINIYLYDGSLYVGAWHSVGGDWTTFISTAQIESGTWHDVTVVLDAEAGTFNPQAAALSGYLDGEIFAQRRC